MGCRIEPCAAAVLDALLDCKGFDEWWDSLEIDVQDEVKQKMQDAIGSQIYNY